MEINRNFDRRNNGPSILLYDAIFDFCYVLQLVLYSHCFRLKVACYYTTTS